MEHHVWGMSPLADGWWRVRIDGLVTCHHRGGAAALLCILTKRRRCVSGRI